MMADDLNKAKEYERLLCRKVDEFHKQMMKVGTRNVSLFSQQLLEYKRLQGDIWRARQVVDRLTGVKETDQDD